VTFDQVTHGIMLVFLLPLLTFFLIPLVPVGFWLCVFLLGGIGAIRWWGHVRANEEIQEIEDWVNMAEIDR